MVLLIGVPLIAGPPSSATTLSKANASGVLASGARSGSGASADELPGSIRSAGGAPGGTTATGQGADQGEDSGENLHQFGAGALGTGPTRVGAVNTIASGDANGGAGGNVTAVFNNIVSTRCTPGASTAVVSPLPVVIRSGNGAAGGRTGGGQGSDQGEDQGENVGQRASAVATVAPTTVTATNRIKSGRARGGDGGNVALVLNQYTRCIGGPSVPTPPPPPRTGVRRDAAGNLVASFVTRTTCSTRPRRPIVIQAGNGGRGGKTGSGVGADQGEDQGENIAQFSAGSSRPGPTSVGGRGSLVSPDANGRAGHDITLTFYNYIDTSCGSGPSSANAPIVVSTGVGGSGGLSGTEQGSDQGEDQGENIGQFASGRTVIGPVRVLARNSIVSGAVGGGTGGAVRVTYNDFGSCAAGTVPGAAADERVSATAAGGGAGGASGQDQGADQGEDQGENIGQFAKGKAIFGAASVTASSSNVSGWASGGAGGSVSVTFHAGGCSAAIRAFDEAVAGSAGSGGAGGETGRGQGADQGEDQGENVAQNASGGVRFSRTTITAVNRNIAGNSFGGRGGDVTVDSGTCPAGGTEPRVATSPGAGGDGGTSGLGQGADQAEDQGENVGMGARSSGGSATISSDSRNFAGLVGGGRPGVVRMIGCPASSFDASRGPLIFRAPAVIERDTAAATGTIDPDITICRGTFSSSAIDVQVPTGSVCRLTGATVTHNVDVETGATLIATRATVGHDISAYRAAGLRIIGGAVGHAISTEALSGSLRESGNAICGVKVSHDLLVQDSIRAAGMLVIGGDGCAGNRIGHDLWVYRNARATVIGNRVGHDAVCPFNRRFIGRRNRAAHVNSCDGTKLR